MLFSKKPFFCSVRGKILKKSELITVGNPGADTLKFHNPAPCLFILKPGYLFRPPWIFLHPDTSSTQLKERYSEDELG